MRISSVREYTYIEVVDNRMMVHVQRHDLVVESFIYCKISCEKKNYQRV